MARIARFVRSWLAVNGGVALVAAAVCAVETATTTLLPGAMHLPAAVASTAALYALVFTSCSLNLRGRQRLIGGKLDGPRQSPVLWSSIVWHPLGSVLERCIHTAAHEGMAAAPAPPPSWIVAAALLAVRLLAFEAAFDVVFYFAHRAVHLPGVYDKVTYVFGHC